MYSGKELHGGYQRKGQRDYVRICGQRKIFYIDEVDKNADNQIFLSFLGLLRNKYLEQQQSRDITFWSVILAGVYDIKNLKVKLHPGQEDKYNSPWNIAADFTVTLFDDMVKKLYDFPELKKMLFAILFKGEKIPYNPDVSVINIGTVFGFLKNSQKTVAVSNRIFETRLYDMFLAEEILESRIYKATALDKNQFISGGS